MESPTSFDFSQCPSQSWEGGPTFLVLPVGQEHVRFGDEDAAREIRRAVSKINVVESTQEKNS